jgi:prefoldin subunit 5
VFLGCSSYSERLQKEYDLVSKKIEGVQNELKATVNAQHAAEDYLKAFENYNEKIEKLQNVRSQNDDEDIPIGPSVKVVKDPYKATESMKGNYDILSDKISELKKERARIVEEQVRIEKEK